MAVGKTASRRRTEHGVSAMTPNEPMAGPGDFQGAYDVRSENAADGGQSTYAGTIAVTLLDRGLVEAALPGAFRLATQTTPSPKHPVIHLIGDQRSPRAVNQGVSRPIPLAQDYREMILLVPFVVNGTGTQWHNFVVRMYLDQLGPIAIGNTVYAYAKELAQLPQTGSATRTTTEVSDILGRLLFESEVRRTGAWRSKSRAGRTITVWSRLRTIFEMPLVGVDPLREVCSYWEWDHTRTQVAPAASTHRFVQPFRSGMEGWVSAGALSSPLQGAVEVRRVRWRLALQPPACAF